MRRLFWLGVGIAVGVVAARQVTRTIRAYSPGGLAGSARESAAGLIDSVRDFVADVREGMIEREAEIHEALARGVTLDELAGEDLAGEDLAGDDPTGPGPSRHDRILDGRGRRHEDGAREDGAEVPR